MNHEDAKDAKADGGRRRASSALVSGLWPRCSGAHQQRHHPVRLEALVEQVAIQAAELRVVVDRLAAAQPLAERGVEQRVGIERAEDVVDGLARGGRRDAGLFDLQADAQLAAPFDRRLGPRDGLGDAGVVDRALLVEAATAASMSSCCACRFAGEALADLRLGQLAPAASFKPST